MLKTGRRCWLQMQIYPDCELRGTARLTAAALTVLALLLNFTSFDYGACGAEIAYGYRRSENNITLGTVDRTRLAGARAALAPFLVGGLGSLSGPGQCTDAASGEESIDDIKGASLQKLGLHQAASQESLCINRPPCLLWDSTNPAGSTTDQG